MVKFIVQVGGCLGNTEFNSLDAAMVLLDRLGATHLEPLSGKCSDDYQSWSCWLNVGERDSYAGRPSQVYLYRIVR